jgi:hypothetical protein
MDITWNDSRYQRAWQLVAALIGLVFVAGCSKTPATTKAADDGEASAEAADPEADAPAKERKTAARKKKPAKPVGAHIGEIPLDAWPDVWLKDPLSVAAEKAPAGGAAPVSDDAHPVQVSKTSTGASAENSGPDSGTGRKAGGTDWAAMISGEVLADEAKAARTSLTDKLQSVGKYSGNYKALRVDAAVLSTLAGVAIDHPEPPSWKSNARYIRDVSAEVARASSANGEKFYKPAREAFDKLDALFSGSKPAGLQEAAKRVAFSEVVKRNHLMERMQRAYDWIKSNANTEANFKKESAKVDHEAAMLALLAKVAEAPGYESADDDEYRKYAEAVTKSGIEIEASVKEKDFQAFAAALDRCYKACTECHQNFRNN